MHQLMLDLNRFRAVVFDFDGVIVDSETMQARAWTRVARQLGQHERDIAVHQIAGRLDIEVAAELFPECDSRRCAAEKLRIETEMESSGGLRLIDGVEQFVRRISRTHLLAICSSCHHEPLARRVNRTGLAPMFRVIVGRRDGTVHKPSPDLYLRALAALGVGAPDACAIEDSPTGIAAAKSARICVIQLLTPGNHRSPDADAWIERFADLDHPIDRAVEMRSKNAHRDF
jgi:putative hydrolase of the HAD superfamily